MATPIIVMPRQWDKLKILFNYALIRYNFKEHFSDGLVVIQDKTTTKTALVHWYELVMDVILLNLAKKASNEHWKQIYYGWVCELTGRRLFAPKDSNQYKHPIDFAFQIYTEQINNADPKTQQVEG